MNFINYVYIIVIIYLISAMLLKYKLTDMLKKSEKLREFIKQMPIAEYALNKAILIPVVNTIALIYFLIIDLWFILKRVFLALRDLFITKNPNNGDR